MPVLTVVGHVPTAADVENDERGHRNFNQLQKVTVAGLRFFSADFADHKAQCLLETRTGAYTAGLAFDSEDESIRIRIRLPHGVKLSAALERVQVQTAAARLQLDPEHRAALVVAGYPFFDGSPAQATMDFAVGDLRALLDSPEFAEAVRLGREANSTRQSGGVL